MDTIQIRLVQDTFEQVKPIADLAADMFYARLFELDPALRPLFAADLTAQKAKLMAALTLVVGGLRQPETVLAALQHLGRRHSTYGVQPHHYDTVGAALLWTLERGLGDEFTPPVAEAWAAAYGLVADAMQTAAAEAALV